MEAKDIRRDSITELPPLTPLQTALIQSGVQILNNQDVLEYQAETLKETRRKQNFRLKRADWFIRGILLAGAAFCAYLAVLLSAYSYWSQAPAFLASVTSGVMLALFFRSLFERRSADLDRRPADWRRYDCGSCFNKTTMFTNPVHVPGVGWLLIPGEVEAIARRIAKTGVTASFELVQLDHDPFLVVVDGRERYYVAVWDEKGFCG